VLVEAVRGDKNKEAYEYEVRTCRRDKTDVSRSLIVSALSGRRRKKKGRRKKKKSADLPGKVTPLATLVITQVPFSVEVVGHDVENDDIAVQVPRSKCYRYQHDARRVILTQS
jgi:hypothetical protein